MYYDCRFFIGNDLWHRFLEIGKLICLATAVWSIRDVEIMSHPSEYPDMYHFCAGLTAAQLVISLRYVEVMWCQWKGRSGLYPEAYWVARRDLIWTGLQLVFYVAATVFAATQYFGGAGEAAAHTDDGVAETTANETLDAIATTGDYHRSLASEQSEAISTDMSDIPVIVCLVGCVFGQLVLFFIVAVNLTPQYRSVPIQRYV